MHQHLTSRQLRIICLSGVLIGALWLWNHLEDPIGLQPCISYKFMNAMSQAQTINSQLELYRHQLNTGYPTLEELQDWSLLTEPTVAIHGPYLQAPPRNPFNQSTKIAAPGHATSEHGWEYNEKTGWINAVIHHEPHFEAFDLHLTDLAVLPQKQ